MPSQVLVVEDSPLQAKMYKSLFAHLDDVHLYYAQNGQEALDKLALEPRIQLILLDINMPKMDGLTFLDRMKTEGYSSIPVIVISTEGKDEDIRKALHLGARAYVKKPWKPAEVHELIDNVLSTAITRTDGRTAGPRV